MSFILSAKDHSVFCDKRITLSFVTSWLRITGESLHGQLFGVIFIQNLRPVAYFVLYFPFMAPFSKMVLFSKT